MKSASYMQPTCNRCRYDKHLSGTEIGRIEAYTWINPWVRHIAQYRVRFWARQGGCGGCYNVALYHEKVMAVFLCKLGIEPQLHPTIHHGNTTISWEEAEKATMRYMPPVRKLTI